MIYYSEIAVVVLHLLLQANIPQFFGAVYGTVAYNLQFIRQCHECSVITGLTHKAINWIPTACIVSNAKYNI